MLIVDAQIHLWNAGNPTNATHRQVPAYKAPGFSDGERRAMASETAAKLLGIKL